MPGAVRQLHLSSIAAATLLQSASIGRSQTPFRASLTATVIIQTAPGARKNAPLTGSVASVDQLGCRQMTLRWADLVGAHRYVVYVSPRTDGPWSALPAANVCGHVQWRGATLITDVEPSNGAPSVVHRLYYKVFALAADGPDAATLAVTDPVVVELP